MSVVVVGGDYLGTIGQNLYAMGATEIIHVTGRKALDKKKICIPNSTAFVLVLTDYINHGTATKVKDIAKSRKIPLVFAKRAWSAVEAKLKGGGLLNAN